jgi:hypothetical protein
MKGHNMKITFPPGELVTDQSLWNYNINPQILLDAGVTSVILGLYRGWWNPLKWDNELNANCRRIADKIAASKLIMQTYYYYYPERDPIKEATWFANAMKGYPVKFAWADCEAYKANLSPAFRSEQHRRFTVQLKSLFQNTGVYTANWYIAGFAPNMNMWLPNYKAWVAHYGRQPGIAMRMTWDQLKVSWMPDYNIILAKGQPEAQVAGHQFTGDRCILPGTTAQNGVNMAVDVSLFTPTFMNQLRGGVPIPVPPPVPTNYIEYTVNRPAINVRNAPYQSPATWVRVAYSGETFRILKSTIPASGNVLIYVQTVDGLWIWLEYLKIKA